MRSIFLLWGLLFAPLFLCAQTNRLAGKVVDEEGAPIFAANAILPMIKEECSGSSASA